MENRSIVFDDNIEESFVSISSDPIQLPAESTSGETEGFIEGTYATVTKNPSVTVFDVAAYVLKSLGRTTTMKLQKIIYYCQAWSLVWDEKPLFEDRIEAWVNGPVIPKLYSYHRGHFEIESIDIGNPSLLDTTQRETVDKVLDYYGPKPAQWLIQLSHMEQPWINARKGISPNERGSREITIDALAEYYSSL